MTRTLRALTLAALLAPAPLAADQISFSLGVADLRDRGTTAAIGAEYRTSPLGSLGPAPLRLGAAGELDARGDWYLGTGPAITIPVGGVVTLDASVMPGIAGGGGGGGSEFALRSRAGVSAPIGGGWRGGLHLTHRSNVSDSLAVGFTVSTAGF
jgi:hypothetical protein